MRNVLERIRHIINLLDPHPVVLMPKKIKSRRTKYLTIAIAITMILDLFSLTVKGATISISNGHLILGFALIVLYYLKQSMSASTRVFLDQWKKTLDAESENYVNSNIISVSNTVRGKVYSNSNSDSQEVMQNSEIIFQMHNYIKIVWEFWTSLPQTIFNILTLSILSFSMIYMEWTSSNNLTETSLLTCILILCGVIYVFLTKRRIKVRTEFRTDWHEMNKKKEKIKTTLETIEPICTEEFEYRAKSFLKVIDTINSYDIKLTKKFNILYVFRSLTIATFMLIILLIKVYLAGGIFCITGTTIAEIIAIGAIYEAVLDKIVNILVNFEDIINNFKDLEDYSRDFCNILTTYDQVNVSTDETTVIDQITIERLVAEYPKKKSNYKLLVNEPVILKKGQVYLFIGPSGCGKSTMIHLITGKMLLNPSPISYGSDCKRGYLASLLHETGGRLGTEYVLNEIIFDEDSSHVDKKKLMRIMRGLLLYDNIRFNLGLKEDNAETEERVLEYLATTNIEEYSAGQKQRLSIAKLLYNLQPKHQIVAFDEATNALRTNEIIQVLQFIKEYCMEDTPRIILFASHQVEEMMTICDKVYSFDQTKSPAVSELYEVTSM